MSDPADEDRPLEADAARALREGLARARALAAEARRQLGELGSDPAAAEAEDPTILENGPIFTRDVTNPPGQS